MVKATIGNYSLSMSGANLPKASRPVELAHLPLALMTLLPVFANQLVPSITAVETAQP